MVYDTSSDKTGIPCARPDCRCLVFDDNEDENVHRSAFCSTGCAGGLGCDHHECNCSSAVSTPVLVAKSGILEVQSYGATDRGLRRATNQDHFMTARLRKSMEVDHTSIPSDEHARFQSNVQGQLLLVADGMGGHAAGERASQLAVDSAAAYVLNTIPWFYRLSASCDDDFQDELKRALEFCQRELSRDIDNQPMNRNMGTTLTMAYVIGEHLYAIAAAIYFATVVYIKSHVTTPWHRTWLTRAYCLRNNSAPRHLAIYSGMPWAGRSKAC